MLHRHFSHYIAYTSVVLPRNKNDLIAEYGSIWSWFQTTFAFQDLKNRLGFFPLEPEADMLSKGIDIKNASLIVDIIDGHNVKKKHPKLNLLLEFAKEIGEETCICISNMNVLAYSIEEILNIYNECRWRNIGIFIPDNSKPNNIDEFSICKQDDEQFVVFLEDAEIDDVIYRIDSMSNDELRSSNNRGKTSKDFPTEFLDAYFMYEAFKISETTATSISSVTVNTFHAKAKLLETSNNILLHYDDLPYEEKELNNHLHTFEAVQKAWYKKHNIKIEALPKRFGRVPKDFHAFRQIIEEYSENEITLDLLCETATSFDTVPSMTPLDFKRYCIKADLPSVNKAFPEIYKEHYDIDFERSFEEYHISIQNRSPKEQKQLLTIWGQEYLAYKKD